MNPRCPRSTIPKKPGVMFICCASSLIVMFLLFRNSLIRAPILRRSSAPSSSRTFRRIDVDFFTKISTFQKTQKIAHEAGKKTLTRPASHGNKKARRDGKKSAITRELDMYTNIYKLRPASKKERKQSSTKREYSAQKPQKNPQAPHEILHKKESPKAQNYAKNLCETKPCISERESESVREHPN